MTDMIENCCFASPSQTEPDTQTITRRALLAVLPMVLWCVPPVKTGFAC